MSDARWMDLVQKVSAHRDEMARRADEIVWALLASEGTPTIFGKPFTAALSWPDGLPLNFKTDDELRAYAREQLARLRARSVA